MRRRRTPEIIAGRVNPDGTTAAGDGFTVVKGSTGVFTINFPAGFRLTTCTVSEASGENYSCTVSAFTASSVNVVIYLANTAAATNQAFAFIAVGVQQ
jgi:hypothetical protein